MRLYHPTLHSADILRDGFGESSGAYLTETDHSGVWLYDRPVAIQMGGGDEAVLLEIDIPESLVAPFEWGSGLPYRQFLMPAALINLHGRPRVVEDADS
jgi:hypothetical protein